MSDTPIEPRNYDHVFTAPIAGSLRITGASRVATLNQDPPKTKLRLFVNEDGMVDAEYDNITEAAQALIEEVRRNWVDTSRLHL